MDLEHTVEGTFAKVLSTFGVPMLISVVGILGGIVLTDMRNTLHSQGAELQDLRGDLREVKATLDGGLMWRINEIERRLNKVEDRPPPAGANHDALRLHV